MTPNLKMDAWENILSYTFEILDYNKSQIRVIVSQYKNNCLVQKII